MPVNKIETKHSITKGIDEMGGNTREALSLVAWAGCKVAITARMGGFVDLIVNE